jgi:hypothetical protein
MDEVGMRLLDRIYTVCNFTTQVLNALIPSSQRVTVLHKLKQSFCLIDVSLQAILTNHPRCDFLCSACIKSQNATELYESDVIVDSTSSEHVVLHNCFLRDGIVFAGSLIEYYLVIC